MKKRVALVVNGINGCGSAICQKLSGDGVRVISSYQPSQLVAAKIWQERQLDKGFEIDIQEIDLKQYEKCEQGIQKVEDHYSKIDILINNVDVDYDVYSEIDADEWKRVFCKDLSGLFNITKNVVNGMVKRNSGCIINISYLEIVRAKKIKFMTKYNMHAFTQCLAKEVIDAGVVVNTISAGFMDKNMYKQRNHKDLVDYIPLLKVGSAAEVVKAVDFLINGASNFITGSHLLINGGLFFDEIEVKEYFETNDVHIFTEDE